MKDYLLQMMDVPGIDFTAGVLTKGKLEIETGLEFFERKRYSKPTWIMTGRITSKASNEVLEKRIKKAVPVDLIRSRNCKSCIKCNGVIKGYYSNKDMHYSFILYRD